MHAWMFVWMHAWMVVLMNPCMTGCMDVCMDVCMDACMDGCINALKSSPFTFFNLPLLPPPLPQGCFKVLWAWKDAGACDDDTKTLKEALHKCNMADVASQIDAIV